MAKARYRATHIEQERLAWAKYQAEHHEEIREKARLRYLANREAEIERGAKYRAENPDKVKESAKKWRSRNYARFYANNQKWHAANPNCKRKSGAVYRAARRDEACARTVEWRRANPECANAQGRNKRAYKAAAEGFHTAADIRALWLKQGKRCAVPNCCHPISDVTGSKDKYHVDHIIPLKPESGIAGTNWPDNLQILCPTHNMQKRNNPYYVLLP